MKKEQTNHFPRQHYIRLPVVKMSSSEPSKRKFSKKWTQQSMKSQNPQKYSIISTQEPTWRNYSSNLSKHIFDTERVDPAIWLVTAQALFINRVAEAARPMDPRNRTNREDEQFPWKGWRLEDSATASQEKHPRTRSQSQVRHPDIIRCDTGAFEAYKRKFWLEELRNFWITETLNATCKYLRWVFEHDKIYLVFKFALRLLWRW